MYSFSCKLFKKFIKNELLVQIKHLYKPFIFFLTRVENNREYFPVVPLHNCFALGVTKRLFDPCFSLLSNDIVLSKLIRDTNKLVLKSGA